MSNKPSKTAVISYMIIVVSFGYGMASLWLDGAYLVMAWMVAGVFAGLSLCLYQHLRWAQKMIQLERDNNALLKANYYRMQALAKQALQIAKANDALIDPLFPPDETAV